MGDTDAAAAIRYATAADAPELSRLAARTFRATYLEANDRPLVDAYIAEHYSTALQSAELQDERLTYFIAETE